MHSNIVINDKLLTTARTLEKASNLLFSQFGMTSRTYEIMIHVHAGENTTLKLATILQSSLSNITHKTKLLENQGYLRRMIDDKDKRIWYFSLTSEGEKVLKTIHFIYEKATEKLYTQFSDQQKKQILEFLTAVEEHLRAVVENEEKTKTFVSALTNAKKT